MLNAKYVEPGGHKGSDIERRAIENPEKDEISIDYFELCNQHRLGLEMTGDALVLPDAVQPRRNCLIANLETWSPV